MLFISFHVDFLKNKYVKKFDATLANTYLVFKWSTKYVRCSGNQT